MAKANEINPVYLYAVNQNNMKQKSTSLIIIWLSATLCLTAQITITDATFPAAGDSLKTATDIAPQGIVMTPSGGPQTWDFSSLNPSDRQVTLFQPAAEGSSSANFPGAELVSINAGAEVYYDVSPTAFSILGISGEGLGGGFPIEADFRYAPPLVEREAPLNFFDVDNYASNATIALATSDLPSGLLDSLGFPSDLFDSIRIRISVTRFSLVDGYGTLTIPGGTYDVLRQKRTDYTATGLDVHTFLGWVDIGAILGSEFAFPTDTTITFNFLSNTAKEPIAIVTVDSTELVATEVVYKDNGIPSAINPVTEEIILVMVSPNPASEDITFEIKNFVPEKYNVLLFDSNGRRVLTEALTAERQTISIASLSAGMYLYKVMDKQRQVVFTGKFVKS